MPRKQVREKYKLDDEWISRMRHLAKSRLGLVVDIKIWTIGAKFRVRWRDNHNKTRERDIPVKHLGKAQAMQIAQATLRKAVASVSRASDQHGSITFCKEAHKIVILHIRSKREIKRFSIDKSSAQPMSDAMLAVEQYLSSAEIHAPDEETASEAEDEPMVPAPIPDPVPALVPDPVPIAVPESIPLADLVPVPVPEPTVEQGVPQHQPQQSMDVEGESEYETDTGSESESESGSEYETDTDDDEEPVEIIKDGTTFGIAPRPVVPRRKRVYAID
jgi:hypothetical protein